MRRVNARPIVTSVANQETIRNYPSRDLPTNSVRFFDVSPLSKVTVSFPMSSTLPCPTRTKAFSDHGTVLVDLLPEPYFYRTHLHYNSVAQEAV